MPLLCVTICWLDLDLVTWAEWPQALHLFVIAGCLLSVVSLLLCTIPPMGCSRLLLWETEAWFSNEPVSVLGYYLVPGRVYCSGSTSPDRVTFQSVSSLLSISWFSLLPALPSHCFGYTGEAILCSSFHLVLNCLYSDAVQCAQHVRFVMPCKMCIQFPDHSSYLGFLKIVHLPETGAIIY